MSDEYLNLGYERYATWTMPGYEDLNAWGGFMLGNYFLTVAFTYNQELNTLTGKIINWDFNRFTPERYGNGFIDVVGFSWYDDQAMLRPDFDETWYANNHQGIQGGPPFYPESWDNVQQEALQMAAKNNSAYWVNKFFVMWQNNQEGGAWGFIPAPSSVVGAEHTWQLSEADWGDAGQIKDRIVILIWARHYDDDMNSHHVLDHPRTSHWVIMDAIHLSFERFNWKFHPFSIRKDGQWYSCNRLDSEVGHGDGHTMIRKGGRWNGVWNDDYKPTSSEAYYDKAPEGKGPMIYVPRSGIGRNANRPIEQVHEWEDQ